MESVKVSHRDVRSWSDRVAHTIMRLLRWGMDTASGYRHDYPDQTDSKGVNTRNRSHMTERKWLIRLVFLESVAGVPGMVAASLRHLHSLRRMERDNGW